MGARLGFDFSKVRIHDDAKAGRSAKSLQADAYTVGSHIVMRRPADVARPEDRELLAHELVHVAQAASPAGVALGRVASPTEPAEQEATHFSERLARGWLVPTTPSQRVSPGTILPRLQTTRGDFHDPNFCYRPGVPRDATHPDRSKVVAVMQAQIETPESCDGIVRLRTSVLQSAWGAASAEFESYGGGTSQGIRMGIHRDDDAERVDYEEDFELDTCHAWFSRCHLITFYEGGTKYTFAEAGYQPMITAVSTERGTQMQDRTPAPRLVVEPCNNVTPALCGGGGGAGGAGGG